MARFVIVLEEGSDSPPADWVGAEIVDSRALGVGDPDAWTRLHRALVEWCATVASTVLEIFICLPDDEVRRPPNRKSLGQLLQQARSLTPEIKLFIVTQPVELEILTGDGGKSRELWMRTALEGRVQDILQLGYNSVESIEAKLRGAADEANHKYEKLKQSGFQGTWRSFVDPEAKNLQQFLSIWMQYRGGEQSPNLLIVVDDVVAKNQCSTVGKALRRYRGRRYMVATLKPASPELDMYCDESGLLRPVRLAGELELWYFLLRLNESHSTNLLTSLEDA